jgi:hypothetical protein
MMKGLRLALATFLVSAGIPVFADQATPGNSSDVFDCDYIVTTVSRGDFLDCETNHDHEDGCFKWAHERKALLERDVGADCERGVRKSEGPGGCRDQGMNTRILYHAHRGLQCTVENGCTGRDGAPQPHDHWEFVHFHVDCT